VEVRVALQVSSHGPAAGVAVATQVVEMVGSGRSDSEVANVAAEIVNHV